jgi:hypothetical protein
MKRLEPPDSLHLQAAQGWLELGNHVEADAELDKTPSCRAAPFATPFGVASSRIKTILRSKLTHRKNR